MKIEARSFSSKQHYPKPLIADISDLDLGIILIPWGDVGVAEAVLEEMKSFLSLALSDTEATNPYEVLMSLSKEQNILRNAIMLGCDWLFRNHNKEQMTCLLEVILFKKTKYKISFAKVGGMSIYNATAGHINPIVAQSGYELISSPTKVINLPFEFFGQDRTTYVQCGEFSTSRVREFVLSSSPLPVEAFNPQQTFSLNSLTKEILTHQEKAAGWLMKVEI